VVVEASDGAQFWCEWLGTGDDAGNDAGWSGQWQLPWTRATWGKQLRAGASDGVWE
jgi:hypothetical protein